MARKTRTARAVSPYSVHPSISHAQAIIANLSAKTGRSIDQWVKLVRQSAPAGEKERRAWLKSEHKLGGTTAWMIAERANPDGPDDDIDPDAYLAAAPGYVDAMYAGAKSALRPIHDALVRLGRSLGDDVKVCPCKTIVPLYRRHVFAEIKPATRTRIDLGLALKGFDREIAAPRIDTGGLKKGDRITHRIPVSSGEEIDAEVSRWLMIAYDLDGR